MRKILIALGVLSATLTLTASASAARPATTVHAKPLGVVVLPVYGETAWVAKADARTIAWGSTVTGSRATTITDAGAVRAVPAQPGCAAQTAGAGSIGYDCSPVDDEQDAFQTLSTRVVSLAGAVVGDASFVVPIPPMVAPGPVGGHMATFRLDGLGTRWAHYSQNCDFKYCTRQFYSQDVNWQTGAAAMVKTLDPRLRENLDAAALTVPLCAPLRSDMAAVVRASLDPRVVPVVLDRRWALLAGDTRQDDPNGAPTWRVQRCGSPRPVTLPPGSTPVTIGAGWVLLARGSTVQAMRLADHRLVTVTGAGRLDVGRPQGAIIAGRAVFTAYANGSQAVYTARLPRR